MNRLLVFCFLSLALGCAHQAPKKEEPPVAKASRSSGASSAKATTTEGSLSHNDDCGVVRVHFPTDSIEIDAADKQGLERSAQCLKNDHALHVTIEGNADERGTEEYNLALGDRRASAVSKYLQALGASPVQLKTVSYGKENPVCTEHDEACWAKNRQAAVKKTETPASK